MRLIDADTIVNYEVTGNFECGDFKGLAQCVWLPVEHLSDIPTVKHYFTEQEYRILLAALDRERIQCKQIGTQHLPLNVLDNIEKKIHKMQYGK